MIKNVFKGFVIGIAKIVPGVSGSMLAISFGVYEKLMQIIANPFRINFNDFRLLFELSVGILLGVCLFSHSVKWLLSDFYLPTMLLFVGLIIGGVRGTCRDVYSEMLGSVWKGNYASCFKLICFFLMSFAFVIVLSSDSVFNFSGVLSSDNIISYFILGIVEAFSSIVPGISGTAIYMSLGCYDMLLDFFGDLFNPIYFRMLIWFSFGILFAVVMLAKIITYLINNYKLFSYVCILGFMAASLFMMLFVAFSGDYGLLDLFCGVALCTFGYNFIVKLDGILAR